MKLLHAAYSILDLGDSHINGVCRYDCEEIELGRILRLDLDFTSHAKRMYINFRVDPSDYTRTPQYKKC